MPKLNLPPLLSYSESPKCQRSPLCFPLGSCVSMHGILVQSTSVQFSSVASRVRLCDPMNCSTPGLPVRHELLEFTQTHVHRVGDAIQPSHPLSSPSPPAPNPSQLQSLFQWVNSLHEVAKVLEFQLVLLKCKRQKHHLGIQLKCTFWLSRSGERPKNLHF